jgi:hypothetical protein
MIADPADKTSLSYRFRSRRDRLLREFMLAAKPRDAKVCRVVDLGGGSAYWERVGLEWLKENGFSVTCINYNAQELTRDSGEQGQITLAVGDACNLSEYADGSFDIVHSNSVIEHVGGWKRMAAFAREVRRLAPSYYLQTPNFWFPADPHFFRVPMIHWLPPAARAGVHMRIKAGWAPRVRDLDEGMSLAESDNMLSAGQMRYLFPDAEIQYERVAFLPKSIIATRLGLARTQ